MNKYNKYIEIQLVEAKTHHNIVQNCGDIHFLKGKIIEKSNNDKKIWYPEKVFNKMHIRVGENNTVTEEMIEYMIDKADIKVNTIDNKTTIVHCVLPNGFTMVESSSCIDPTNYDELVGTRICLDRIKEKLWGYLGFLLQTAINGFGDNNECI